MKTEPNEIRSQLSQCTGTEGYTKYLGGLLLTDGVVLMADLCQAYWLLDIIASYQPQLQRQAKRQMGRAPGTFDPGVQFWKLRLSKGEHRMDPKAVELFFPSEVKCDATIICAGDWEDNKPTPEVIRQYIEYTDFPLPEGIDLWVMNGHILLPSEN